MLPNFIVIGPGKSGTTWMYHALQNHPQICVSSAKETLFFETDFERGIEWYSGFFSHCDENIKATGEVSNTYIFCRKVPNRIKSVNPNMKIISCLRNPVERTFSHYLFLVRGGQFSGTFREALDAYPHLIEKGKYFKNLKPYFEVFEDHQICIKLFDELKADQNEFIKSIYHYLEVDDNFTPNVDDENRLSAAKPRNRFLALLFKRGAQFIRSLGHPELISTIKYSGIRRFLYKKYKKDEKPTLNAEERAYLIDEFSDDIEKLGSKLKMNLRKKWFD